MGLRMIYILFLHFSLKYALVFPPNSVIQLVGSISVPVVSLPPHRRIAFDWGFQMNYDMPFDTLSFLNSPIWTTSSNSSTRTIRNTRTHHPRDFTLVEMYKATEEIFRNFGFHESCLLLLICELMLTPFDARQQNFISKMLSFLLRPSMHRGIAIENYEAYDLAEFYGTKNFDCKRIYTNCSASPLDLFSGINFS